ncbi:hypothetical protein [Streptomyces sp. NPDC058620]|uniref:hypothetical protein n=1 Tax=Streptomyces sp. NPDC058620 TaxID=3346560 RepID=UPI003650E13D
MGFRLLASVIWGEATSCDGIILPFTSTELDGATSDNVACQTHIGNLTNTIVLGWIANFVAS